jgi:hypothetical protein
VRGGSALGPAAIALLLVMTVLFGVAVALWNTRPVRVTFAQRTAGRIWSSRVGRALFARAERRYARQIALK